VDERAKAVEAANRAKFGGDVYKPAKVSVAAAERGDDYASRMMAIKLDLVRRLCSGPRLLDVCCSTGLQLQELADERRLAVGVDFSMPYLEHAAAAGTNRSIALACANVRALPFRTGSIDGAYSISSLYVIPNVGEVISEIGRVLRPGGRCLLDLGNVNSLNHIVTRAYPELATTCFVPVPSMIEMIGRAGMEVIVHRSFQLLPMWGDRPRSLRWLMSPRLTRLMAVRVAGRMLDEWVSSLPIVRRYAFRHVFVCQKAA
jgi:ubiquinone/menaquinone biosynthesis C-methylase UbiE